MSMKKFHFFRFIIFIAFVLIPVKSFSQDALLFANNYLNPFIINPAVTGSEIYPQADLAINKQWLAFPNSPGNFFLAASARVGFFDFYDPKGFVNKGPLKIKDRIGLGVAIFRDNNGPLSSTSFNISYAYNFPVNQDSRLSLGMSLLGSFYSINTSLLKPDQMNDPFLFGGNANTFRSNFGVGAYYYSPGYFAGISASKLLPDITNTTAQLKEQPGYFLLAGYKFMKDNYLMNFEPSITIKKFAGTSLACDLHAKLYVKKLNWIALSYSTTQNVNLMLGLHLFRMVYLGYNYGYTISKIASFNYGSHEIHLGINLGLTAVTGIRTSANDIK
jgi:type IX secretion system PorP/SprF family membrane protein